MASKITPIILCLCFAFVLLISSEAASRDLTEITSKASVEKNGVTDSEEPPRYRGEPGGGYGGGIPGGRYGGGPGGPHNYGGRSAYRARERCRYGCCARDYSGGCRRCCSYSGQVVFPTKP